MDVSRRSVLTVGLALSVPALPGSIFGAEETDTLETVTIPGGAFIRGSDAEERDYGYTLDEAAYGHSRTRERGWYDHEAAREPVDLRAFDICRTLITNSQYADFIRDTGHPVPDVNPNTWAGYRLIHPYERTRRHAWRDGTYPEGRGNHPVVMVSYDDVTAYAAWVSEKTGQPWSLPSEDQWEKAARGTDGRYFPWGNDYDPSLLNSHDAGPFDTMPVGSFPAGASPFGALDMAGHVFEWTSTARGSDRHIVKGGSWDDSGCGVCRAAARHSRPNHLKHILVGFRLVRPPIG